MGIYKHLNALWQSHSDELVAIQRERLIEWRKEPVTLRIEHPTRLDRARSLGYRAKLGVFIVRQRVSRGGHKRPTNKGAGRKSKNASMVLMLRKNYQIIAEERASRAFNNCEVLNSYYVGEDGQHYWYEIIMVDRAHPSVLKDSRLSWIANARGRAHRGLTSAGRGIRGLHRKGTGAEKARPSRRANNRRL